MAHNCLNGVYSSVPSLALRVDLFDPCDFLKKMPVAILVHLVSVCHLTVNPYIYVYIFM